MLGLWLLWVWGGWVWTNAVIAHEKRRDVWGAILLSVLVAPFLSTFYLLAVPAKGKDPALLVLEES